MTHLVPTGDRTSSRCLNPNRVAWTVRFGPLPRDHMRAVLDRFAW